MMPPKTSLLFIACFALSCSSRNVFAIQHHEEHTQANHTTENVENGTSEDTTSSAPHKEDKPEVEHHDKANITAYLQNVSAEATKVLMTIWETQRIPINGLEEEKNVIFQTYRVELKRITYLINRTYELVERQCKSIKNVKWNEKDENGPPQPYHDEVIGELANYWNEIERFFRENKLKGVDVSVRRINRLIQRTKEELNNRWDRLKKLVTEMKRLKSY